MTSAGDLWARNKWALVMSETTLEWLLTTLNEHGALTSPAAEYHATKDEEYRTVEITVTLSTPERPHLEIVK